MFLVSSNRIKPSQKERYKAAEGGPRFRGLKSRVEDYFDDNCPDVDVYAIERRKKAVVTKLFSDAGLVVPVENDVGYREMSVTYRKFGVTYNSNFYI